LSTSLQSDDSDRQHNGRTDYYTTRQALDQMEDTIQSVLNYLASEDLSQASLNQLTCLLRNGQYVTLMKRAQEYMQYIGKAAVTDVTLEIFIQAWNAISDYLALMYRQAHRNYMQLRRSHKINMLSQALQKKRELGECCCQAQKESLLLERKRKHVLAKHQNQQSPSAESLRAVTAA
jgi:hypothetical protein